MSKQTNQNKTSLNLSKTGANKVERKIVRIVNEDRGNYLNEQFQKYIHIKIIND